MDGTPPRRPGTPKAPVRSRPRAVGGPQRAGPGDATVQLLHGDERFLVDERGRELVERWRADLVSDFGLETVEGATLTPPRLMDSLLQAPFLDPYRVVLVRMVPAARADAMAPALSDLPSTTRAVITVAGRIGPSSKLAKAVLGAGGLVEEMVHLRGRALSEWTTRRAVEKHGLSPALAALVVRLTPPDLAVIDSELNKLAAYRASGAELTREIATELLAQGRQDEVFRLTDLLLPSPAPEAFAVARGLTRAGMQPTSVAYRMARHLALVLEVHERQQRGESLSEMQDAMPEHRFVIQKAYDAAGQVDPGRLESALVRIRDYEWEVKSGQIDAELGLEVLLSRL